MTNIKKKTAMSYHTGMSSYVSKFIQSNHYSYSTIHELGRRTYNGFPADLGIIRETQRLATKVMKGIVLLDNDISYLNRLTSTPL